MADMDVREGDSYDMGHISLAMELPFSEIELKANRLLPRRNVRIVIAGSRFGRC
jgi:rhodanese-related sulfurtransferase